MSFTLSMLAAAAVLVAPVHVDSRVIARMQSPPYELSLVQFGEPFTESCSLEVVAERHGVRHSSSAGFGHFKCEARGRQAFYANNQTQSQWKSVVLETGFGGDGDHTGPILMFFSLDGQQLNRKAAVEVFSPKVSWREDGSAEVAGRLLFTYCDVCDGPGLVSEELYLPVVVTFDGNAVEVIPLFDDEQAQAYYEQFESFGKSLHGEAWPSVREKNDHVVNEFDRLMELLRKTGWSR